MNAFAQTSARAPSGSKLDNRRMLAALVDLAIVAAGGAAILLAAGVLGGDGGSLGAPLAGVVVGWALYYYFACESGGGQTVGKRLTRLRVAREDGSPAEMREIAVRTVLRLVDTALVGLIAMLATGERRARVGDLAAGTMIVSTEATPGMAPAASEAPVEGEPESHDEELPEVVDDEPARAYEPITREDSEDEPEPAVEVAPRGAETEPAVEHAPVVEHTLDLATPSLKELAEDVAAAAGAERVIEAAPEPVAELAPEPVEEVGPEPVAEIAPPVEPAPRPRPLAEVEIGGPEIDVDEPRVTVRSVDTVSAIDLVMGADEPTEDRPSAGDPPAGA